MEPIKDIIGIVRELMHEHSVEGDYAEKMFWAHFPKIAQALEIAVEALETYS